MGMGKPIIISDIELRMYERAIKDSNTLADFVNKIASMLCGCCEAPQKDIVYRCTQLLSIEKEHNRQDSVNQLFEAIHDLHELAKELEESS